MRVADFTGVHKISQDFTSLRPEAGYVGYVDRSAVSHSRTVRLLPTAEQTKKTAVDAGALHALVQLLRHADPLVQVPSRVR